MYLLVDSLPTLEVFLEQGVVHLPEAIVITLSGEAISECEQRKIPYRMIEDFADKDEILDISLSKYRELLELSNTIDEICSQSSSELMSRGIRPFAHSYFFIKMLGDAVLIKGHFISGFLNSVSEAEVWCRASSELDCRTEELYFDEEECLTSLVLFEVHKQLKSKARLHKIKVSRKKPKGNAGRKLRCILNWRHIIKWKFLEFFKSRENFYVLFSEGYDIPHIMPLLRENRLYPKFATFILNFDQQKKPKQDFTVLWQRLRNLPCLRGYFSIKGMDLFALVEGRLSDLVGKFLPAAVAEYDLTIKWLSRKQDQIQFALVNSINYGLIIRSRMQACRSLGLKLVSYQEGAGYGSIFTPMYDYTEMQDGDLLLSYGDGNVNYYKDQKFQTKPIYPVGSAFLDNNLKKIGKSKKDSLMYVGTTVSDNVLHAPSNGFSTGHYFKTQKVIFENLARLPERIEIIIKLHPADKVAEKYLRSLPMFARFRVETRPLEDCVGDAELLLLDFPSTTFLNCLQTNASIFVLAEKHTVLIPKKSLDLLKLRAYYFENSREFNSAIETFFNDRQSFPEKYSNEYLKQFGTHLGDGKSAQRAVKALLSLKENNSD